MTRPGTRRAIALAAIGAAAFALSGCALLERPERDSTGQVTEGEETTDVFTLRVGDCLNDADATEQVDTVPTTPCDEPHDSEVFASVIVPEDEYPGQGAILELADVECLAEFETFVGGPWDASPYDFSYYFPTEGSWSEGDREILCVIYDPEGPVTGSLAGASAP